MKTLYRHIRNRYSSIRPSLMMLWLLLALVSASCSSSSSEDDNGRKMPLEPAVLNVFVYAPGQSVPTRGNTGPVDADLEAETAIHTLQIWVYTHVESPATPQLVTYFSTTEFAATASADGTNKLELPIPDSFADQTTPYSPRPRVDVYVLANVAHDNCGQSFDENTSREVLENAVLQGNFFGLSETPVSTIPADGLPMSGVLRDQQVTGERPVLTLRPKDDSEKMATVTLARVVSKVRFVFSCSTDFASLKINEIKFNSGMIPNQEYFFLEDEDSPYTYDGNAFHINGGEGYNTEPSPSLFSIAETARCADPAYYAWDRLSNDNPTLTSQELAEAYEDLINEGLTSNANHAEPRLTERRVYLRESDKQLSGTITYQVKESADGEYGEDTSAAFRMDAAHDFSRNHTWTVYAYLSWAKMYIVNVVVNRWSPIEASHEVYNW